MNERYNRQTGLPGIGQAGQEKIRRARVLVVGAGGLGSPVCTYLAGAGIGTLGIIDPDTVDVSNLHRQVLFREDEAGQPKAPLAARRLRRLNGEVRVETYAERLAEGNAAGIIGGYDVVVDACDNVATRYLVSDVTARLGKPYVYGAVGGFEGQASVFNVGPRPRTYRDLYPEPIAPPADKSIVGMAPAVIGSVEAHEVLKLVCGYGEPLAGKLWCIDLRTMQTFLLDI